MTKDSKVPNDNKVQGEGNYDAAKEYDDAQRKLATLQRDLARAQARLAYTPVIEGVRP